MTEFNVDITDPKTKKTVTSTVRGEKDMASAVAFLKRVHPKHDLKPSATQPKADGDSPTLPSSTEVVASEAAQDAKPIK